MKKQLSTLLPVLDRRLTGLLPLLFAALLAGCAIIAPYDETTDRRIAELSLQTETALAEGDAGELSPAEKSDFLHKAIGTVRAIRSRSELYAKNQKETDALKLLEEQYRDLASRPLRTSIASGVRLTLLNVQQIQISKKRSATFSDGLQKKNKD